MANSKPTTASGGDSFLDKLMEKWWGLCLVGAIVLAFTAYLFHELSQLESGEVDKVSATRWIAFLYNIGGKWGVTAIFVVVGIACIGMGIKKFADDSRAA